MPCIANEFDSELPLKLHPRLLGLLLILLVMPLSPEFISLGECSYHLTVDIDLIVVQDILDRLLFQGVANARVLNVISQELHLDRSERLDEHIRLDKVLELLVLVDILHDCRWEGVEEWLIVLEGELTLLELLRQLLYYVVMILEPEFVNKLTKRANLLVLV